MQYIINKANVDVVVYKKHSNTLNKKGTTESIQLREKSSEWQCAQNIVNYPPQYCSSCSRYSSQKNISD